MWNCSVCMWLTFWIHRCVTHTYGWQMVKSETCRDAEILVRNPNPRLFDKKFRDSKKVKTNHAKTRLRDLSKTLPRFRDPAKIFRDPRFSRYHSPPLHCLNACELASIIINQHLSVVFRLIVVELKIQRDLKDSRKEERKPRNKH